MGRLPIENYGVLKCRPVKGIMERRDSSPHYQIICRDDSHQYRIAVNVKSKIYPSEVKYLIEDDFQHAITEELLKMPDGTRLLSSTGGDEHPLALDYIRKNLFDYTRMIPLPHDVAGPDNDLNEKLDFHIRRAIMTNGASLYVFGSFWGLDGQQQKGMHNVHMNQGNVERFEDDDGVYQDGGLLIYYPQEEKWTGIFLAFQSQSFHTDDETGHRIDTTPEEENPIRIVAALANPPGHDPGKEQVMLINLADYNIELTNWVLTNKRGQKHYLQGNLEGGDIQKVLLPGQTGFLSNRGGIITLLDSNGLKIDGVSYTKRETDKEGWTILFR